MNPYEVLGVPPSATAEEIRAAYRRLTLAYHPDRNPAPQAGHWMAQINRAYAILSDPAQRAAYDRQQQAGARVRCPSCTHGIATRGYDGRRIRCPICLGSGTISREEAAAGVGGGRPRQEETQRRAVRHNWQQLRDEGRNTAQCARCGLIRTQNRARSGSSSAAPWDYYTEGRDGRWERAAYGLDRDCLPQPRPTPTQTPSASPTATPPPPRPTPTAEPAASAPPSPAGVPTRRKSRGWLVAALISLAVVAAGSLAFGWLTDWGADLAPDSPAAGGALPLGGGLPSGIASSLQSLSGAIGNDAGRVAPQTPVSNPLPGVAPVAAPPSAIALLPHTPDSWRRFQQVLII